MEGCGSHPNTCDQDLHLKAFVGANAFRFRANGHEERLNLRFGGSDYKYLHQQ